MKKITALLILLMVGCAITVGAEGFLPQLSEVFGVDMPSFGEMAHRYPAEQSRDEEGTLIEVFEDATEAEYTQYGELLAEEGCLLQGYTFEEGVFSAVVEREGKTFEFAYDTENAAITLRYPQGTHDAWLEGKEAQYQELVRFLKNGDYEEAARLCDSLRGYRDVDEKAANDAGLADIFLKILNAKFSVGNLVTFGRYPQNSDGADETPVEWLVLARDGGRALLLSHYGLVVQPYHTEEIDITWEDCSLRAWLNDAFLNRAFSPEEQAAILTTDVDNGAGQGYDGWYTRGGNDTQDRVFLLSYGEANRYLGVTHDDRDNVESRVSPTNYAKQNGAWTSDSRETSEGAAAGWWWLRSPGYYQRGAARVNNDGSLNFDSVDHGSGCCVRPAIWVDLDSGIF